MKAEIPADRLPQELKKLKKTLADFYIINGDEPLLVTDSRKSIAERAVALHYQRHRFEIEPQTPWRPIANVWGSYGLFGGNRLVELNFHSLKALKAPAAEKFMRRVEPTPGATMVIVLPAMKRSDKKPEWLTKLHKQAQNVLIKKVGAYWLAGFIATRAQRYQLRLSTTAVKLLQDNYEGNLEALDMELRKLQILYPDEVVINPEHLHDLISASNQHDIFQAMDQALLGNGAKAWQVADYFEHNKMGLEVVLATCSKDLRVMRQLAICRDGNERGSVLKQSGLVYFRHATISEASARLSLEQIDHLLALCQRLDLSNKGSSYEHNYQLLKLLLSDLAGDCFYA